MPRIATACMLAIAFRWGLVATRLCGHRVHWLVWTATTLAIAGAGLFVFRVPTRERIELELLDKLGVSRAPARAALEDRSRARRSWRRQWPARRGSPRCSTCSARSTSGSRLRRSASSRSRGSRRSS